MGHHRAASRRRAIRGGLLPRRPVELPGIAEPATLSAVEGVATEDDESGAPGIPGRRSFRPRWRARARPRRPALAVPDPEVVQQFRHSGFGAEQHLTAAEEIDAMPARIAGHRREHARRRPGGGEQLPAFAVPTPGITDDGPIAGAAKQHHAAAIEGQAVCVADAWPGCRGRRRRGSGPAPTGCRIGVSRSARRAHGEAEEQPRPAAVHGTAARPSVSSM